MTSQDAYYRWVTRDAGTIGLEVTYRGSVRDHVVTHWYVTVADVSAACERFARDHAVVGFRRVAS